MGAPLRLGILWLDSSHCTNYTALINDSHNPGHIAGGRVVAAWPGGSTDWDLSINRVGEFRTEMESQYGVAICDTPQVVAEASDVVLILTVDGRNHRQLFQAIAPLGRPVFIDKPLAISSADAQAILEIGVKTGSPWFTSSVWRWEAGVEAARLALDGEVPQKVVVHAPWPLQPGLHGWFWYGIHWVEVLYQVLGAGCQQVTAVRDGSREIISGFWGEGSTGTLVIDHASKQPLSGVVWSESHYAVVETRSSRDERYGSLIRAIYRFASGGPPPVAPAESVETICFLEAAANSARANGSLTPLSDRSGS